MFTPIDLNAWPRRAHFHHYRTTLPVAYSLTVRLDVTRFRAMLKERDLRFYPSFIWCVSHTILAHPAFRMGVDGEGNPGTHDVMHPNYTIFHQDDHTFSDCWTPHDEDFAAFYRAFWADRETYGDNRGVKARPGQPANFYCISGVPWVDFTGYSTVVPSGQPNLFPVFTFGKITEQDGKAGMPLALSISHAAADGWHSSAFFQSLQELLDTVELSL